MKHLEFADKVGADEALRERVNEALIKAGDTVAGRTASVADALDMGLEGPEFARVFDRAYNRALDELVDACGNERTALGYVMSMAAQALDEVMAYRLQYGDGKPLLGQLLINHARGRHQ